MTGYGWNASAALLVLAVLALAAPAQESKSYDKKAEKEVAEIAKVVGSKMEFFESANFTWCSVRPEAAMKSVVEAAERAFEVFGADAKIANWRQLWGDQKAMVVVLADKKAYREFIQWYAQTYPVWSKEGFVQAHSKSDYFQVVQTRRVIACHFKPHDLAFLTQVVAHQTGFLAAHRLNFNNNFVPPWFEEFTAAWIEGAATGKMLCSTRRDTYGATPFKTDENPRKVYAKLRQLIKKEAASNGLKTTRGIMKPRLNELSFSDLKKGYALIDWMRSQPGKYSAFTKAMKRRWPSEITSSFTKDKEKAQEEAFKEVFGLDLSGVDEAVAAHAKANL